MITHKHAGMGPTSPHMLDLSWVQNLKAHSDESKDSDDDSKFDAFVEALESNGDDLIVYD